MKRYILYTILGIVVLYIVLALERYVFRVEEDFYTLIQLPIFVVFGFIVYGKEKKISFSGKIGAWQFGAYSLTGHLLEGDISPLTILLSALLGFLLGILGGFIRKITTSVE